MCHPLGRDRGVARGNVIRRDGLALLSLVAIEEVSKVCATSGLILTVQELGSLALKLAGSEEQKMRLLPSLASGETLVFRPGAGLVARLKIAEWPKLAGK